jgi:dienelactone hydrolase
MRTSSAVITVICLCCWTGPTLAQAPSAEPFPSTAPLAMEGDLAAVIVDGADRFLLRHLEQSVAERGRFWQRDLSSAEKYNESVAANRRRLSHILGVRDARVTFRGLQFMATTSRPPVVARGASYEVLEVRWPTVRNMHGEGLLLRPVGRAPLADVIAIPDAEQTPEMLAGLVEGTPPSAQFARRLAELGCRVVVPVLVDRQMQPRNERAVLTNREYLYRSAFELGRHLIGYELQKVLALADWFELEAGGKDARIGVIGWGEGGMLALYAAAIDTRIDAACVSGYFNSRQNIWQEPLDRNVFGLLEQFGDAELATLVAPRALWIEASRGPELELPGKGGGPARLVSPVPADVQREHQRALSLVEGLKPAWSFRLVEQPANGGPGSAETIAGLLESLSAEKPAAAAEGKPELLVADFDPAARQLRQVAEIDDHNQWLLEESPYVRAQFMAKLDTSSPEKYQATSEEYRKFFRDEVIGRFDDRVMPPNPRSRKICETPQWTGYDVVLDVYPELIAYGILCVPKDIAPGEKRPVVVCQHGLEGRPQDVVNANNPAYHDFAARLAERGFITFAPQNLYIFQDRFRTLQRKANPLKKTLFSLIVPQHQQIVDWLKTLPIVDANRIAFYGLSYGGKSAMRIPPLVTDYCLSICSADFNDWVWKNAATRGNYSYVWTGEYEIFEFDLGSTFNYSEMAALIAPRPFMVERGHFDGVAPDDRVGLEYAKIRHLYAARLGLPDRTEIEWFVGPHTINGQGTFKFLHRHLNWPDPKTPGGKD